MSELKTLSMSSVKDREALQEALAKKGVAALESDLGGGMHALEILLVPDNGREAFSILASSVDGPCEIGLSGFRTDGVEVVDCASAEPLRPDTLSQAVEAVLAFWLHRGGFVQDFGAGRYDLN